MYPSAPFTLNVGSSLVHDISSHWECVLHLLWLETISKGYFFALSLEILWFRVVDVAVKSNAFTFGTVLAVYLFGLGTGSLVGGPLALRLRRPLQSFLLCQCALLMYAGLAVLLLASLPTDLPVYDQMVAYWGHHEVVPRGTSDIFSIGYLFSRGDADNDGEALMADAVYILKHLYVPESPHPQCLDTGDADDDGEILMADVMYLLKHLYVPEMPAPPPPFPDCGMDPTSDQLDCQAHGCMP